MKIRSHFKEYSVDFTDSLSGIKESFSKPESYFVIDRKILELYEKDLSGIPEERLFTIDATEKNKTVETALDICEKMTVMPSKRNTHLISVGGGIVQDITGFVANVLYRGIDWTFYPSTLLAGCDSCIGGKTSLNYKGYKNLLGTFYPPDEIYIYTEFFKTLTERDFLSGLGEVVKFNVMAGKDGIDLIERDIDKLILRDNDTVNEYAHRSLSFKKDFIEEDEFDKGRRILLNFAHTFGHAYEVSSVYEIPHGSAVALGMITADHISVQRGMLEEDFAKRIEEVCRKILKLELRKEWFAADVILGAIRKDKKQVDKTIRAVLMDRDLTLHICPDVTEDEVCEACRYSEQLFEPGREERAKTYI